MNDRILNFGVALVVVASESSGRVDAGPKHQCSEVLSRLTSVAKRTLALDKDPKQADVISCVLTRHPRHLSLSAGGGAAMRAPRTTTLGANNSSSSFTGHGRTTEKWDDLLKEPRNGLAGSSGYDWRSGNRQSRSAVTEASRSSWSLDHADQKRNGHPGHKDSGSHSKFLEEIQGGTSRRGWEKSHATSLSSIQSNSDILNEIYEATRAGLSHPSHGTYKSADGSSMRTRRPDSFASSGSTLDDLHYFSRLDFIKNGGDRARQEAEKEEAEKKRKTKEPVFRGCRPNSIARSVPPPQAKSSEPAQPRDGDSGRTSLELGGDSWLASGLGQTSVASGRKNPSPYKTPSGYFSSSSSVGFADDDTASIAKSRTTLVNSVAAMDSPSNENGSRSVAFSRSEQESGFKSAGEVGRSETTFKATQRGSIYKSSHSIESASTQLGEYGWVSDESSRENHSKEERKLNWDDFDQPAEQSKSTARETTPTENEESSPFRRRDVCRPLSKAEVLDILYTIYTPEACALQVRQSRWIRPLVEGEEAWAMMDDRILQQTDFRTCLKLAIQSKLDRAGVVSIPADLRLAVEEVRDPDEALAKVENYLATMPTLTAR